MSESKTFSAMEAASAVTALRAEIGLPPQDFEAEQLVGMISDEIDQLRQAGIPDSRIVAIVNAGAQAKLEVAEIAKYYAPQEARGWHGK